MTSDLIPDYGERTLHVAFDLAGRKDQNRGLIYDPRKTYSPINASSRRIFEDFFERQVEFSLAALRTRQGPGELAKTLETNFGTRVPLWIGGVMAPLDATKEEAQRVLKDLREHPERYYASTEEKDLGGRALLINA